MKEAHKKFTKVFAALLPSFSMIHSFPDAFRTGLLLGAAALFVTHLFILLKPLFPKEIFRVSVILFLAVLFQTVQGIFHPSPFWIVSLALLLDWNDFDPKHLGQRPLPPLVRAGIFSSGVFFAGAVVEILGNQKGVAVFRHPAGLLAAAAVFSSAVLSLEKPLAPLWLKKRKNA